LDAASEESEVRYTEALIDQAADAFSRNFFRTRYGQVLMVAAMVNVAAVPLVVWAGLRDAFPLFVVAMIAALGVVYVIALRFYYPRKASAILKQRLMPTAKIAVTPAGFRVSTADRAVKLPWSDVTRILEFADYFILVLRPARAFTIISKQGFSHASRQLIREATTRHEIAFVAVAAASG
jgi:hypothetical protein